MTAHGKRAAQCAGALGWLLGHKFRVRHIDGNDDVYSHCLRCGRKAGTE